MGTAKRGSSKRHLLRSRSVGGRRGAAEPRLCPTAGLGALCRALLVPKAGVGGPGAGVPLLPSLPASLALGACREVWRASAKKRIQPRREARGWGEGEKRERKRRYSGTKRCFDFS